MSYEIALSGILLLRSGAREVEMRVLQTALLLVVLAFLGIAMVACDTLVQNGEDNLKASGVVEVVEVIVAPEIGGRVVEVFVVEGDPVQKGEALFELDDELLNAQREQAVAAHSAAKANFEAAKSLTGFARAAVESAHVGVEVAGIQYELELRLARLEERPTRTEAWERDVPNEFDLPVWYFEKAERLSAAEAELVDAWEVLEIERANFEKVLDEASRADLRAAEIRLSEARAAFLVVDELSERGIDSQDRKFVDDFIDTLYDAAETELEDAQEDYEKLLTEDASDDVLEVRARLIVAQERYETALDQRDQLLTGEEALPVRAAEAALRQAEAALVQAEAQLAQSRASVAQAEEAVAQTQAALDAIDVQIDRLTVRSAVSGVVMTRSVEPGEVILSGMTAMTIGQLDRVTITVYLPEDRYGQIDLGEHAQVSVDSFPDRAFDAIVIRISDRAEYTPRNVQTEEDRRTTVYAVELSVEDPQGKLKPGMPADVVFGD